MRKQQVFTMHLYEYELISWFVGLSVCMSALLELKISKTQKRVFLWRLCN